LFDAYFAENGSSKTGLSPTIIIRKDSDGSVVVNGLAMTETGDGFYTYDYAAQDFSEGYHYICDSVTLTGNERYAVGYEPAWNRVIEGALTQDEIMRILLSFVAGPVTGGGSGTIHWRDQANSKDRITMPADGNGNRSGVTVDGS